MNVVVNRRMGQLDEADRITGETELERDWK